VSGTVFSEQAEDLVNVMRMFVRGCFAQPLAAADEALMLGINLQCPSRVRAAMFSRSLQNDDMLTNLDGPILVIHGTNDEVINVETSQHIVATAKGARMVVAEGAGHAVFWEEPGWFDAQLAEFASSVW
jgi:pimeloyl-ACP methyl ester carboxylesterase